MHRTRFIIVYITIALIAAASGFGVYSAFVRSIAIENSLLTVSAYSRYLNSSIAYVYGTVESVDLAANTITIVHPNAFALELPPQHFSFLVSPYTLIASQNLIPDSRGIYTQLSQKQPISLHEIHIGDRVEIVPMDTARGLSATLILVGNPL